MAKFLHTRIRVSDLEKAAQFYCDNLNFEIVRRMEKSPAGNQIIFLEIPGSEHGFELTYSPNYEVKVPSDLMHIAIGVPDLIAKCDELTRERSVAINNLRVNTKTRKKNRNSKSCKVQSPNHSVLVDKIIKRRAPSVHFRPIADTGHKE